MIETSGKKAPIEAMIGQIDRIVRLYVGEENLQRNGRQNWVCLSRLNTALHFLFDAVLDSWMPDSEREEVLRQLKGILDFACQESPYRGYGCAASGSAFLEGLSSAVERFRAGHGPHEVPPYGILHNWHALFTQVINDTPSPNLRRIEVSAQTRDEAEEKALARVPVEAKQQGFRLIEVHDAGNGDSCVFCDTMQE